MRGLVSEYFGKFLTQKLYNIFLFMIPKYGAPLYNRYTGKWIYHPDYKNKKPVRMITIPNVTHSFLGGHVKVKIEDWEKLLRDIRNLL